MKCAVKRTDLLRAMRRFAPNRESSYPVTIEVTNDGKCRFVVTANDVTRVVDVTCHKDTVPGRTVVPINWFCDSAYGSFSRLVYIQAGDMVCCFGRKTNRDTIPDRHFISPLPLPTAEAPQFPGDAPTATIPMWSLLQSLESAMAPMKANSSTSWDGCCITRRARTFLVGAKDNQVNLVTGVRVESVDNHWPHTIGLPPHSMMEVVQHLRSYKETPRMFCTLVASDTHVQVVMRQSSVAVPIDNTMESPIDSSPVAVMPIMEAKVSRAALQSVLRASRSNKIAFADWSLKGFYLSGDAHGEDHLLFCRSTLRYTGKWNWGPLWFNRDCLEACVQSIRRRYLVTIKVYAPNMPVVLVSRSTRILVNPVLLPGGYDGITLASKRA